MKALHRPFVPGGAEGAEGAIAHPDYGRSVNPISIRGDRVCPSNYNWHPRVFKPSYSPASTTSPSTFASTKHHMLEGGSQTKPKRHPAYNRLAYRVGASSLDPCKFVVFLFFDTNISLSAGSKIQRYLFKVEKI